MNKLICLATGLLTLTLTLASGQPAPRPPTPMTPAQPVPPRRLVQPPPSPGTFSERLQTIVSREAAAENPVPALTRFDLDFPGGTPAELVKAIEQAMKKPLNAIIPSEDADIQLPPLKMNDVVTPQLFAALEAASRKTIAVTTGGGFSAYSSFMTGYGFRSADGPITDTSIWYFHVERPSLPPVISSSKICRFYSLAPYLNRGFSVDDITTAIQTGWKMAGVTPLPELNYHKETKLLIAFGEPSQLQTIQDVLNTLPQTQYSLPTLDQQVKNLQDQVAQLKQKMAPPPASLPDEKSGK